MSRFDKIQRANTVFRVGRSDNAQGLWYDVRGCWTGQIETLTDGQAGKLPMGIDPIFHSDGHRWYSATDELGALRKWFSEQDIAELTERGYDIQAYTVSEYRRVFMEYGDVHFQHEVFSFAHVLARWTVDPWQLYPNLEPMKEAA